MLSIVRYFITGSVKQQNRSQAGCGISILGDNQNLTGESPEQPYLTSKLPLLGTGDWTEACRGPSPPELFYNFKKWPALLMSLYQELFQTKHKGRSFTILCNGSRQWDVQIQAWKGVKALSQTVTIKSHHCRRRIKVSPEWELCFCSLINQASEQLWAADCNLLLPCTQLAVQGQMKLHELL